MSYQQLIFHDSELAQKKVSCMAIPCTPISFNSVRHCQLFSEIHFSADSSEIVIFWKTAENKLTEQRIDFATNHGYVLTFKFPATFSMRRIRDNRLMFCVYLDYFPGAVGVFIVDAPQNIARQIIKRCGEKLRIICV